MNCGRGAAGGLAFFPGLPPARGACFVGDDDDVMAAAGNLSAPAAFELLLRDISTVGEAGVTGRSCAGL
jgi:hypothetical protein